jgi:hypothetical protein
MMKKFLHFVFIIAALLLPKKDFATHVIGSELRYDYVTGNTYKVQLTVFIDCATGINMASSTAYLFLVLIYNLTQAQQLVTYTEGQIINTYF